MSHKTIAIAAALPVLSVLALGSPFSTASANPLAKNLFNSGVDQYDQGDYQGAMADYTKAIEINPEYAPVYYFRGSAKDDLGDYQGAIDDYTKAIEIDPEFASAYNNRGIVRERVSDLEGTCRDWRKAVDLGDERPTEWVKKQC